MNKQEIFETTVIDYLLDSLLDNPGVFGDATDQEKLVDRMTAVASEVFGNVDFDIRSLAEIIVYECL